MAIFTFSTKGSRPQDTETIERIKTLCTNKGLNFSALVLKQLEAWETKQGAANVRCDKV